jgi:hypothetical protein
MAYNDPYKKGRFVMNPESTGIKLTKFATKTVVGFGTSKIVHDIIKNNSRTPVKFTDKVTITAASVIIGMIVSDATEKYATGIIDSVVNWVNELQGEIKFIEVDTDPAS